MKNNKDFKITDRKGFQLIFSNGLCISVQFGAGNYCDNYNSKDWKQKETAKSDTSEIAIMDTKKHYEFVTSKIIKDIDDDVKGYVTSDEVADLIIKVKRWKRK